MPAAPEGVSGPGGRRGAAPSIAPPPPRAAVRGWRSEGVKGRRLGNLMLTKPQECCTFPFPSSFRRRSVPAAGNCSEEPSPEAVLAPGAVPHLLAGYAGRLRGATGRGGGLGASGWCKQFFLDLGCAGGTCKTEGGGRGFRRSGHPGWDEGSGGLRPSRREGQLPLTGRGFSSLAGAARDAGETAVVGALLARHLPLAAGRRGRHHRALPRSPLRRRWSTPAALPWGPLRRQGEPPGALLPPHRHAAAAAAWEGTARRSAVAPGGRRRPAPRRQGGRAGGLPRRGLHSERHPSRLPGPGVPAAAPPAAATPRHGLRRPRRGLPRARPAARSRESRPVRGGRLRLRPRAGRRRPGGAAHLRRQARCGAPWGDREAGRGRPRDRGSRGWQATAAQRGSPRAAVAEVLGLLIPGGSPLSRGSWAPLEARAQGRLARVHQTSSSVEN